MVEAAAQLLAVGFRVLLAGHQVGNVLQADLAPRQQRHESAGKDGREWQAEIMQWAGKAFGRIEAGHSGTFVGRGNFTIDPECPYRYLKPSR